MIIGGTDVGAVDLNLLNSLNALLLNESVTKAATSLSLSQSAMSYNLARLRKLFGDEILTRTAGGMKLTPYARTLGEPLAGIFRDIDLLVSRNETFDPTKAERTFSIALPDSSELLLVPSAVTKLLNLAPGIQLELTSVDRIDVLDALDEGRIDMAIGVFTDGQVHHKRRLLHNDEYVCLFNGDLIQLPDPLPMDIFLHFPHVVTRTLHNNRDVIGEELAKADLRRKVLLTTPNLISVPYILKDNPVIATVPAKFADYFIRTLGLSSAAPPIEFPSVPISLVWHSSHDKDSAHQWLRAVILDTVRDIRKADVSTRRE
jgi:DNA-binding transcriptional LysR family regulator